MTAMKEENLQLDDVAVASPVRPLTSVCPWSAVVALILSLVNAFALAICIPAGGLGPRLKIIDPDELWHAKYAVFLLCPAVVTEMSFLFSSYSNIELVGWSQKGVLQLNGIGDSLLTVAEYSTKLLCGLFLWSTGGGVVHSDQLAWGGGRPVYFVRFLQWAIAVPILVLITNRAFLAEVGDVVCFLRSAPGLLLTALSVWAAWLMEVTPSPAVRWLMWTLSWMSLIWVIIDQCLIAAERKGCQLHGLKVAFLSYQTVTFALYAVVFMFGRLGAASSLHEQMFYAYGDVTIKVIGGTILAMIRNREDLHLIRHWWLTALFKSEDLERITRQANVPVVSLDTTGAVTAWNASLVSLSGLSFDEVKGKKLAELSTSSSREVLENAVNKVVQEGCDASGVVEVALKRSPNCKLVVQAEDRLELPLLMNFLKQTGKDGSIESLVGIGQDLTEVSTMKAVEEKKSRLMAVVSHELRSPLHGMIGLTNMMLESEAGQSMKRQLSMVRNCSARLLDLVTNVMDLADSEKRSKAGDTAPRPSTPVNFAEITDEVLVMTRLAVDKANKSLVQPEVRLVNEVEGMPIPIVRGDPYKCTQLLYNMVTNACKFTKRGSVTIKANHLKEEGKLEILIKDTGRGISEEAQKRIFKPFEQEYSGDARNFQGMGLGLAVCVEIVNLHRGTIRVQSQLGEGSTFIVTMPCENEFFEAKKPGEGAPQEQAFSKTLEKAGGHPAMALTAQPRAPSGQAGHPPGPHGSVGHPPPKQGGVPPSPKPGRPPSGAPKPKPLVLSVDDDEVNQEVIIKALGGDYEVVTKMDGDQALDFLGGRVKAKLKLPDLVLLDIQMPGMSGFDVCAEIRKTFESALGKLPVIMLSAKAPADAAALEAFEKGSNDYLSKPFRPDVLRKRVAIALDIKAQIEDSNTAEGLALTKMDEELKQARVQAIDARKKAIDAENRAKETEARLASVEQELVKAKDEASQIRATMLSTMQQGGPGANPETRVVKYNPAAGTSSSGGGWLFGGLFGGSEAEPGQGPAPMTPDEVLRPEQAKWLLQELSSSQIQIKELKRQLVSQRLACKVVTSKMELMIQAAEHSKQLLANAEDGAGDVQDLLAACSQK